MTRSLPRSVLARAVLPALLLAALGACADDPTPPAPACERREDCPMGQVCAPDKTCRAAECGVDDDCIAVDPKKVCELSTLTCQLKPPFADDCDDARPCPFGEFCSTLLGQCRTSSTAADCTRRGQCPAGQTCDRDANKCIPDPGCYGDAFCEEGEVCDLVNHVCTQVSVQCTRCSADNTCGTGAQCDVAKRECVAAGSEATCRTGEFCDPLSRCVQCINDDQCGPGTFCNASIGRCESNVQCVEDASECPANQNVSCVTCVLPEVCDRRTRQCQAPATPCDDDIECPGQQFCDKNFDPPVCAPRIPDCLNDLQEPNATALTARRLEGGPRFDELKICPADVDWYRLDVAAGTYLTIDVRFRHADGDIEAQLFLADGVTLVDESRSTTDNERVELAVGTPTTLLLKVFWAVPAVNPTPYELIVARDPGELCPDDGHEDDDDVARAKELLSDTPYEGRICSADPDWFVLRNVPASSRITAHLDVRARLGDLDLELWRGNSSRPLLRAASTEDGEDLAYDASFAGDYYLRVIGKRADANVYTLRAEVRDAVGRVCEDDRFEPNQGPAEPTRAPDMTMTPQVDELSICAGDEDWYVVNLGPGEGLLADIGFTPPVDLDLKLYAPGATSGGAAPIAQSSALFGREHVGWRATTPGDYYVRVHSLEPVEGAPYTLHLERLPPLVCGDDFVDAQGLGDSQLEAFPLSLPPTRVDGLTLCSGDSDWYQLLLTGGFTNVVRLHYIEADATLDAVLYDGGGAQLVNTAGGGSAKEIAVNVAGAGGIAVVFLEVRRSLGLEAAYNLTIDLVPLSECERDTAEPNDLRSSASRVTSSTVSPVRVEGLSMCTTTFNLTTMEGDADWFEIHPPAVGARITARTIASGGDLSLELLTPGAGRRACVNAGNNRCYSDGNDDTELVTFTATTTAPYYLRVGSVYSSAQALVRPLDADTKYRLEIEYTGP